MVNQNHGIWPIVIASTSTPVFLLAITQFWQRRVNDVVQEPYLDEVFHVRQAQVYCAGNLTQWDPKITTPPGLYLISWLLHHAGLSCDMSFLRSLNAHFLVLAIFPLALMFRVLAPNSKSSTHPKNINGTALRVVLQHIHTALNICLFPPLFFFSGLYYTDVASTAFVLLTYVVSKRCSNAVPANFSILLHWAAVIACGGAALFFRQTNIFWVAIFPAGLAAIGRIKARIPQKAKPLVPQDQSFHSIIVDSWNGKLVYDPVINDAVYQDYLKTTLSIGLSAIVRLPAIVVTLIPYGAVLASFAGFVVWNGGVVLGDKANHMATIHIPQMLYFWPYITFFSLPLQAPYILNLFPQTLLPFSIGRLNSPTTKSTLTTVSVLSISCVVALAAIHFNTIVHPFTLADNRHYTFYVFRLLVLRNPLPKYLAAPIYVFCAWAAMLALAGTASPKEVDTTTESADIPTNPGKANAQGPISTAQPLDYESLQPVTVSFVLVYLLTCTLCLVTAPLVEPRYFMLPWLTWRLYVPLSISSSNSHSKNGGLGMGSVLRGYDYRLVLETAWFLLINAVTGYLFLYRGFSWPQEPGKVQRFMW